MLQLDYVRDRHNDQSQIEDKIESYNGEEKDVGVDTMALDARCPSAIDRLAFEDRYEQLVDDTGQLEVTLQYSSDSK